MEQRLAAGEARRHRAVQRERLVEDGLDQGGVERPYGRDVVADTMGAPQVAVLGQREAEEHARARAPLKNGAAASWISETGDGHAGLQRQVGEARQLGHLGGDPLLFRGVFPPGGGGWGGGGGGGRRVAGPWGAVSARAPPCTARIRPTSQSGTSTVPSACCHDLATRLRRCSFTPA